MKNREEIKQEIRSLVENVAPSSWFEEGRIFKAYHTYVKELSISITAWLNDTFVEVYFNIPTDDDWSPHRNTKEIFMYNGRDLYNSVANKAEEHKRAKQIENVIKTKKWDKLQNELRLKTLSDILEKNNANRS